MTVATEKRITLATIKAFVRRNRDRMQVEFLSDFDGMVDAVTHLPRRGFRPAKNAERPTDYNMGIEGAWFVLQSRDYFTAYESEEFTGFHVYNCCGSFNLAIPKA